MLSFKNISKRQFCNIVAKNMVNSGLHHNHIISVISIFFDEMFLELLSNNEFKIGNFGILKLKKMNPRKFFNITENKVTQSIGNKMLKFKINKKLRKEILKELDILKTYGDLK